MYAVHELVHVRHVNTARDARLVVELIEEPLQRQHVYCCTVACTAREAEVGPALCVGCGA